MSFENKENLRDINKRKINEYKKQLKSELFDVENELSFNDDGEAIINCKIGKSQEIFSKYDTAQNRTITNEFNQFLMEETDIIPIRYNLQLKMQVDDDFTEENEKQVKKAIKTYYSFNITRDIVKMKKTNFKCALLIMVGLLLLAFVPLIRTIQTDIPIYEFSLVFAWFFLWEGAGTKVFDSSAIKIHKYNMLRLYNASIVFVRKSQVNQDAITHNRVEKINISSNINI